MIAYLVEDKLCIEMNVVLIILLYDRAVVRIEVPTPRCYCNSNWVDVVRDLGDIFKRYWWEQGNLENFEQIYK